MLRTTQIHMDPDGVQRLFTFDPTIQPNPPHQISVDVIYPEPKPKQVWRDCKSEMESKWGEGVIDRLQDKSYRRGGNCVIVALSLLTGRDPFELQKNAFTNRLMYVRHPWDTNMAHTGCTCRRKHHLNMILGENPPNVTEILTRYMSDRRGIKTLNQFVKRYPKGRFHVTVRGHALAVIDGVVYDWKHSGKRRIVGAWEIH